MATVSETFVPGAYWTPDRAAAAVQLMLDHLASPEFQDAIAAAADGSQPPHAEIPSAPAAPAAPVALEVCRFRRGRPGDAAPFAALMTAADLPPLFIEEFLSGFVAVEHDGRTIACGGAEPYGSAAVVRSVVVEPHARRIGLASEIARLLLEDARLTGATEAFLFTVEAYPFWRRLGFDDVPLDAWPEAPRASWQYQYVSQNPGAVPGIHSMRRRIVPHA